LEDRPATIIDDRSNLPTAEREKKDFLRLREGTSSKKMSEFDVVTRDSLLFPFAVASTSLAKQAVSHPSLLG